MRIRKVGVADMRETICGFEKATKAETVRAFGFVACDRDIVNVSNFDTPQNEVWRTIYKDHRGNRFAWLWGCFYPVKKSGSYGYSVVIER